MKIREGTTLLWVGVLTPVFLVGTIAAGPGRSSDKKPRDVTLTGRIVDLHSYMTGKFASRDPVHSTRACIQAGVPAAVEAPDGLVIVGQGTKGPRRMLARLAYEQVELKGRLYERDGLRYIDMSDAKPAKEAEEPAEEETDDPDESEPAWEEPDEPQASGQGACCLPDGNCTDTDEEECTESGGEYYPGAACEEIDCGS